MTIRKTTMLAAAALGAVLGLTGAPAWAVTPENMSATIQVKNSYASSQTMISYSVNGTIAPIPMTIGSGVTTDFLHSATSVTALAGRITYSRCRFTWSIIKNQDVFPKYSFTAAVDDTSKCSVASTPNYTTGALDVKFVIKP